MISEREYAPRLASMLGVMFIKKFLYVVSSKIFRKSTGTPITIGFLACEYLSSKILKYTERRYFPIVVPYFLLSTFRLSTSISPVVIWYCPFSSIFIGK